MPSTKLLNKRYGIGRSETPEKVIETPTSDAETRFGLRTTFKVCALLQVPAQQLANTSETAAARPKAVASGAVAVIHSAAQSKQQKRQTTREEVCINLYMFYLCLPYLQNFPAVQQVERLRDRLERVETRNSMALEDFLPPSDLATAQVCKAAHY
eukprot:SAG31_NODE_730_length_12505_cov_3.807109_3_plen_155_part_00